MTAAAKPCIECGKFGICCYSGLVCDYIDDWEYAASPGLFGCNGYDGGVES